MKCFLLYITLIFTILSCKATADYDACREETTSVVFSPVVLPIDSGNLSAKIVALPDGDFALSDVNIRTSERMDMSVTLDNNGSLEVKAQTLPDTIARAKQTTNIVSEVSKKKDYSSMLYAFIALWIFSLAIIAKK